MPVCMLCICARSPCPGHRSPVCYAHIEIHETYCACVRSCVHAVRAPTVARVGHRSAVCDTEERYMVRACRGTSAGSTKHDARGCDTGG